VLLFVNKKKQKNFDSVGAWATPVDKPPMSKSFLLVFVKKAALTSFPATTRAVA
jgi:hypothetical protein